MNTVLSHVKTTEDIMYNYVYEEDHCLKLYDINSNFKWVRLDKLLNEINNAITTGNLVGEKGFSSALFLSQLKKELEEHLRG